MRRAAPQPVARAINATLADQIRTLADKVERLERQNAELATQLALTDELPWGYEDTIDAIADHKRGLIDTEELYERTVGR